MASKATRSAAGNARKVNTTINRTIGDKLKCFGLLSFAGLSIYAGVWQIERRKQKIDYLTRVSNALQSKGMECPKRLTKSEMEELKYKKINFEGILDASNEIVVTPRRPPPTLKEKLQLKDQEIAMKYGLGGEVITPCKLSDEQTILVNRGWIPQKTAIEMHENKNKNMKETKQTNENETNSNKVEKMVGLLIPYEFGADFGHEIDLNYVLWPYINRQAITDKWKEIGKQLTCDDEIPIAIQLIDFKVIKTKLDEKNKDEKRVDFPLTMRKNDFLSVPVTPAQHTTYFLICFATGIGSAWYAFNLWRNPSSATRLSKTAKSAFDRSNLNSPR